MAEKKEKKVIDVKEVAFDPFGFVAEKETYTTKVFKEKKVPKKDQYTVGLEPMSDGDCVYFYASVFCGILCIICKVMFSQKNFAGVF